MNSATTPHVFTVRLSVCCSQFWVFWEIGADDEDARRSPSSLFVETLPGDPGQPDAEPGFPAVPGHPGKHRAAGREDEVRSGLKTFCLLDSS